MHEQLPHTQILFSPEDIPEAGYLLGQTEAVDLGIQFDQRQPSGEVTWPIDNDTEPYWSLGTLRVGGPETFEDLDLVAVGGNDKTFVGLLRTEADGQKTWIAASGSEGITVGRDSAVPGLADMPDTVSRKHVLLQHDKANGVLRIVNLDPTNVTTLLPPVMNSGQRVRPKSPKELEAMMAVNPIANIAHYAGSQLVEAETARLAEQQVSGPGIASVDQLRQAADRRRRRQRQQQQQRQMSV